MQPDTPGMLLPAVTGLTGTDWLAGSAMDAGAVTPSLTGLSILLQKNVRGADNPGLLKFGRASND